MQGDAEACAPAAGVIQEAVEKELVTCALHIDERHVVNRGKTLHHDRAVHVALRIADNGACAQRGMTHHHTYQTMRVCMMQQAGPIINP